MIDDSNSGKSSDTSNGSDIEWTLLDRYFSGSCPPSEKAAVEQWAARNSSRGRLLASVRSVWEAGGVVTQEQYDADAGWRALREQMGRPRETVIPLDRHRLRLIAPRKSVGSRRRTLVRVAAAAAAVMLIATGSLFVMRTTAVDGNTAARDEPMRVYATARGQRASVRLTDGTQLWLNVGSTLRIPASYNTNARDVYLDGEAYFDVEHDARKPFRVHAGGAIAEDLGTRFVVRAYEGDANSMVVVVAGRVAFRADTPQSSRGVALERGQLARFDESGLITVTAGIDPDSYIGWRDGRLHFQKTPLAQVLRELERWYDIDISVDDSSLATVPVTATFDSGSVDNVLAVLSSSLDVRYKRLGRRVSLLSATHSP